MCSDRSKDYGEPEDNFAVIAGFWNVYTKRRFSIDICFDPHDVAVMMSLMKHGRIASGMIKTDNYIDAIGYLACASEIATKVHQVELEEPDGGGREL